MSGDVTPQALKRQSHLPGSDNPATMIAGQEYDNVEFVGGNISGVAISGLTSPLPINSGGTGQITANAALNALLPSQTSNSGKFLKTDGTDVSWSIDTDTGITQLTGDITAGPGSGSQAATLATVNANIGSFGSSTAIPSLTVNGKGQVTAASTNAVIAPAGTLTGATLAAGVTASSLTSVGTLTNLTVTNPISGSITGNAATSTVASTVSTVNEAADTTCFPLFVTASGTQSLQAKNNTSLTFNSSTGQLGATTFLGTISTASQPNITSVGTLTGGATGAGFTVALGTSTVTGVLPIVNGGTGAAVSDPVLQVVSSYVATASTGTTVIPQDNTIPQSGEGDQYITLVITPKTTTSRLVIEAVINLSHSTAAQWLTAALFKDSNANATKTAVSFQPTATAISQVIIRHEMTSGSTSATTFKIRAGAPGAGTTTFNGQGGSGLYGGTLASSITITEYAS